MQAAKAVFSQWQQKPLPRLTIHFVASILRGGSRNEESNLELGIGALLAVLAVPGGFISIMLFEKYSSLVLFLRQQPRFDLFTASIPDKYFFIVLSMVVTGMVTVIKWDKILPSRQDYVNLSPLPLALRTILLANSAAILIAVALFALAVNAASILLFPLVVTAGETSFQVFFEFAGVHALCVLLASLFTFSAIFLLMGSAMTVLPLRLFWPFSRWLRGLVIAMLLAVLLTSFAGKAIVAGYERYPSSWLSLLPPVWFVSLYQGLQHRGNPALLAAAELGLHVTALSVLLAVIVYPLCYRKAFFYVEETESGRAKAVVWVALLRYVNDRWNANSHFEQACYPFVMRVLVRNDAHALIFGVFLSVGLVLATQATMYGLNVPSSPETSSLPSAQLLSPPLIAIYFIVSGLRLAFELPALLGANWLFRIILDTEVHRAKNVARKVILTFLTPLVLLPSLIAYVSGWGAVVGILYTLFLTVLAGVLVELLLLNWRKIPFTCSIPGFRNTAVLLLILQIIGFELFYAAGSALGFSLLHSPVGMAVFIAGASSWIWRQARVRTDGLVFEDRPEPEVQRLHLIDRN